MSEVPELLTLTDNVSNDYELGWQRLPGSSVQDVARDTTTVNGGVRPSDLQLNLLTSLSSTTSAQQMSPSPLSMLGVQRK
jgi:hypothetical protein